MEIAPGESAPYTGIIHGDLKPSNVMVLNGQEYAPGIPRLKLIDFGFAMFVPGRAQIQCQPLKGSYLLIGSRFYRAPEQWAQEKVKLPALTGGASR
jgi:serine/threonine protein kinase